MSQKSINTPVKANRRGNSGTKYKSPPGQNDSDSDDTVIIDENDDANYYNTNKSDQNYEISNQSGHIDEYNSMSTPEKLEYDQNVPPTILLDRNNNNPFYYIDGRIVTSANYVPNETFYDKDKKNIKPNLEDYVPRKLRFGGKRRRKTKRNTKRKKTRRHRRRHTRKYK